MKRFPIKILSIVILLFCIGCNPPPKKLISEHKSPKLTVVLIIDQFAYHYLPKLKNNLKHGIKFLMDKGIFYSNAHFPHASPSTSTGHTALSTGTLANYHGFVFNNWFDDDGNKINSTQDNDPDHAVFSKDGTYDYGQSGKNIMVDGLSDQFVLKSEPFAKYKAFALSYKTSAAIPTAGKLGKAIWFDYKTGNFTTSKAYFDKVPRWLSEFNNEKKLDQLKQTKWQLAYPENSEAYNYNFIKDYDSAGHKFSLISKAQKIDINSSNPFDLYIKTPAANQTLIDLAQKCIDSNLSENKKDKLLLWLSLSSLDMAAHFYGPDSMEAIDMLYHLDKQIENFINYINEKVGDKNVLFVLTSDHGIAPIPEIMHKQGYKESIRIQMKPLMEKMNTMVEEEYGIKDLIIKFKRIHLFLNRNKLNSLEQSKKTNLLNMLKDFLKEQPGMKNVWTNEDLDKEYFDHSQLEWTFKHQRYPERSGELICQPQPYCVLTTYPTGTSHRSPYEYDTHVPLIVYQKGNHQRKSIEEKVWATQLPVTLAKILGTQKPSASTFEFLPGIA